MRVISGSAKGQKLYMAKNNITRPTSDRVKESLFNMLGPGIAGSSVLDIFAGTGSIGIEALSRGADRAVFIDQDQQSADTIQRNLTKIGLFTDKAVVLRQDFRRALLNTGGKFDLIFADPPYASSFIVEVAKIIRDKRLLAPQGLFVIEHGTDSSLELDTWLLIKRKKYGQTMLSFYGWEE